MNKEEVAKILLKIKAVSLRTNPPYKWASGILSPNYTDNRILMSYPAEREIIVDSFVKTIKGNKIKADEQRQHEALHHNPPQNSQVHLYTRPISKYLDQLILLRFRVYKELLKFHVCVVFLSITYSFLLWLTIP